MKTMKLIKPLLALALFMLCLPVAGQAPTYDELEFETDSTTTSYKPSGKNYVLIRSKRGTSGVNKTAAADAILSAEVTEIVLVYSELDASAISEREEANRERWENLLKTYPELFQFSTTYKSFCQCKINGDSAAFKKSQGFYVYINGDVPKVAEETKAVAPPPANEPPPVAKTEKAPVAKTEEKRPADNPPSNKTVAMPDRTEVKTSTPPPAAVEKEKEKEVAKESAPPAAASSSREEESSSSETEVAKAPVKKKPASAAKPRKARDPKACRPACYGFGDEDLNAFFKEQFPFTKKERKKAKNWMANVRLQINFDGAVKKAMVTGTDQEFNKKVEEILKNMNNWNAAVKGGVTVKAEVRFTLKFDKETKTMKPFEIMMNPRPSPKCTCKSDSELFD